MFQLAPVGLAPNPRKKVDRGAHGELEKNVIAAVQDIAENQSRQTIIYNLKHPDTIALLRSLDAFFVHGLLRGDRCYWCFAAEFIPVSEQEQLKRHWDCRRFRPLSIAWLKDSLNKSTLHFQMLAYANAQNRRIQAKWYDRNACIRNHKILENLCNVIHRIKDVEFQIETPFIFRTEDVPIALPAPIEDSPRILSPSTSNANELNVTASRHIQPSTGSYHMSTSISSFASIHDRTSSNSYLSMLAEKLPEVEMNLPEGFAEHSYTSNIRDQNYVIDELLENHRKRIHGYCQQPGPSNDLEVGFERDEPSTSGAQFSLNEDSDDEDNKDSAGGNDNDDKTEVNIKNGIDVDDDEKNPFLGDDDETVVENQNFAFGSSPKSSDGSDTERSALNNDNELSDVDDDDDMITGVIPVDSGEIVHLAMEIFRDDGERFQDLFQVYIGHSAGQPALRYMTVTDQFVYFLSTAAPPQEMSSSLFGTSAADPRLSASSVPRSYTRSSTFAEDHYAVKYIVHMMIAISDIAFITVGLDAQVFCIHLKKHKYFPVERPRMRRDSKLSMTSMKDAADDSTQKRRLLAIDSGSKELTKFIVRTLRRTYAMNQNSRQNRALSASSDENQDNAGKVTTIPVFTKSTQLSLVVHRFLQQQLKSEDVEVIHHSLIYWIEVTREADDTKTRAKSVEGYLNVRRVYPKAWVRRTVEWQYSYFVFIGCMLYQFSDSTCKFAQRAYNVREKITQVYEADLKNEDGFVFQLELDEDAENSADGGALQFKCPTQAEMKKWMDNITIALSMANEQSIPVACQFFLTNESAVFAQEGANCAVDGFMRSLVNVSRKEIVGVFSVRTEFHNALIIERDDEGPGAFEYLLLRDERELNRLTSTFSKKWGINVEWNENSSTRPDTYNRIYRYCARLSAHGNLWLCNYTSGGNTNR